MSLTGNHLIAGESRAEAPAGFAARDAASAEELAPRFAEATAREVDAALRAADEAFVALQGVPAERIALLLEAIADGLQNSAAPIIERAHAETALPLGRLEGELGRTTNQTRLFAALVREGSWVEPRIDQGDPDRKPLPKPDVRTMLVGVGPIAVFGASNFPLAISVAGTDTIAAFAARCPVVVKGHPAHAGTCELIAGVVAGAIADAGLPAGMFSLLQGAAHEVGSALVEHPLTKAVAFTGSLRGGRALADLAAQRPCPIPVYAEMGSTNPVFLLGKALEARGAEIANGFIGSVTLGVGQFCTNPGMVFLPRGDAADRFLEAVREAGGAVTPAPMLTGGICDAYCSGVDRLSRMEGVSSVVLNRDSDGRRIGCDVFVADAGLLDRQPELSEEVFGPCSLLLLCDGVDDMIARARGLAGQLTATMHMEAEERDAAAPLLQELTRKAGRLVFNGFPTGIEVCSAMHHGGPYPAATLAGYTSIGQAAIRRFASPVCYQNAPAELLPAELQDANPRGLWRLVNGETSRSPIA